MTPTSTSVPVGLSLDPGTRALVRMAAAIATGHEPTIRSASVDLLDAAGSARWVDELLLQSLLMVGWPRTLIAARVWRDAIGQPAAPSDEDSAAVTPEEWIRRGEATCATVYGDHYAQLRENVRALHPVLDAWMISEGYGRTLSRSGLDLGRRELCVVAQTAVLNAPRQLRSHLKGALHGGVSAEAVTETLAAIDSFLDDQRRVSAQKLWDAVRRRPGSAG